MLTTIKAKYSPKCTSDTCTQQKDAPNKATNSFYFCSITSFLLSVPLVTVPGTICMPRDRNKSPQVYMQETSPSPAARWSIKTLPGSSWDATYPPGWSLFVSSHCLPCSMPAAMAQQPLLLASYQPHCSQPHRAGGARQPTGGSWLVQRKAGNLSEEGSVNAGWGTSAVPSQEESKQSSCFEWGIKERC